VTVVVSSPPQAATPSAAKPVASAVVQIRVLVIVSSLVVDRCAQIYVAAMNGR
jgi:hypothetical protein